MRYAEREPQVREVLAAQYRFGGGLESIAEVARKRYFRPRTVEVPQLRVLLVQTLLHEDGEPEFDYDIVEDGGWLVYALGSHLMYTLTDAEFRASYGDQDGMTSRG